MNVKFHKNRQNTGKILKISCASCHFVKFDSNFSDPHKKFSLMLLHITLS